jgi:sRNA-binding carbon storage regulator CsrA
MLVLARTVGRSVYFGRHGKITVISIGFNGVGVKVEVLPTVIVSAASADHHETRQAELDRIGPKDRTTRAYLLHVRVDSKILVGRIGSITVCEVSATQIKLGFDLPSTEAVTRDDYPLSWHNEQQARRENRRPEPNATFRSRTR